MLDYENKISDLFFDKRLKRPEPAPLINFWAVPDSIKIKNGRLFWRFGRGTEIRPDHETMRTVFKDFLKIANSPDEANILKFAQRWGVLGICKHGMPTAHTMNVEQIDGYVMESGCEMEEKGKWSCEPISIWYSHARQMRAIKILTEALRKAKPAKEEERMVREVGPIPPDLIVIPKSSKIETGAVEVKKSPELAGEREDWETAFYGFHKFSFGSIDPVSGGRHLLSMVINHLLGITGVRPVFWWDENESGFVLQSRDYGSFLLPKLAIQLMLEVYGSPDYTICYECKNPFFLRKGQSISKNSYCEDCSPKVPQREASKRYYHNERNNPRRQKRKPLTPSQIQAIERAGHNPKPGLAQELARKYKVSVWTVYKRWERAKSNFKIDNNLDSRQGKR
jgi:hypothetical protein